MPRILLLEDEEALRRNLADMLTEEGFEVVEAGDGAAGLRLAQAAPVDLVLCDVTMPGLDGYGLLARLRERPETAHLPFIFLTAQASRHDQRRGMTSGADDYLTKPFTRRDVLDAIRSRLSRQDTLHRQRLETPAGHPLTQLPGRAQLARRSAAADALAAPLAVCFLAIDHYSRVTASLGGAAAEAALQVLARRLAAEAPDQVYHLHNADFVVLLPVSPGEPPAIAAERLAARVRQPVAVEGHTIYLTASVGVVVAPDQAATIDEAAQLAEVANERTRYTGGNAVMAYTAGMLTAAAPLAALEKDLQRAVAQGELTVYFQPRIDLRTGAMVGAEALARWIHPVYGPIPPARFIPLAETTDLILALGDWLLAHVCGHLQHWQATGLPPIKISINISARQFADHHLRDRMARILEAHALLPRQLELELTESLAVHPSEASLAMLEAFRQQGAEVALDDFGTGYASLSQLRVLPVDVIKIDRSFVHHIHRDAQNAIIVQSIIQMAHSLGMRVVAEGVEDPAEIAVLRAYDCDQLQGFYFSRPLPMDEFEALLATRPHWPIEV